MSSYFGVIGVASSRPLPFDDLEVPNCQLIVTLSAFLFFFFFRFIVKNFEMALHATLETPTLGIDSAFANLE